MLAVLMATDTLACSIFSGSSSSSPVISVNSPFTFEIIRCRTLNPAWECEMSRFHFATAGTCVPVVSPVVAVCSKISVVITISCLTLRKPNYLLQQILRPEYLHVSTNIQSQWPFLGRNHSFLRNHGFRFWLTAKLFYSVEGCLF